MSKEIKMSETFGLPLNAVYERDYCDEYNFNIYDSSGDILIPCVPDDVDHEAIVEAVNSHDTLTEQVKQLREEVKQLVEIISDLVDCDGILTSDKACVINAKRALKLYQSGCFRIKSMPKAIIKELD